MTIARNLSFLAEGVSSTGVLGATYGGTGQSSITTGDLLYGSASNTISKLAIGSTGTILRVVGGVPSWGTDYTGTVTSVAATVPSFLSISGSPITTSGTLAITYSGTALPVANGGTGLTSLTANYIPYGNGTGAFSSSSSFIFNGTNFAVGLTAPYNATTDIGSFSKSYAGVSQVVIDNQTSTGTAGLSFSAYGGGWNVQVPGSTTYVNPLIFKFNSTETVRMFASGGVSIGNTTDPGATNLSVTGYTSAASFRPTSSTVPTNGMYLPAANAVGFATNSTEAARIDTSGNLLIGNTSAPSGVTNGSMLSKNQGVTNYSNNYAASTTYTATINFPVNKYNGAAGYVFYDLTIGYALYPANPQTTYYQIIGIKLVVDSYYAGNQSYWASYLNAGIPYIVINSITPNVASGNVAINFTTSAAFGSGGGGATVNFNVECIGGNRGY